MKRFFITIFLIMFFLPNLNGIVINQTWYVKTDGTDTEDCSGGRSWENAFKTISKAITCAIDGDEIWVAGGIYNGNISINKSIKLYGSFKGNETSITERRLRSYFSVIDGDNNTKGIYIGSSNATIDGFKTINCTNNYKGGGFEIWGSSNVNIYIKNCDFYNNNNYAIGVKPSTSTNVYIINSNIYKNNNGGIYISLGDYSQVYLINTNISYNNGYAIYGASSTLNYSKKVIILNTIIWGNSSGSLNNNIFNYNTTYTTSDIEQYQLDKDPEFIDPENNNFHLKCTSPCIDTGSHSENFTLPEYDFENDPREIDGNNDGIATVDIGPDELSVTCDDGDNVDEEIENQVPNAQNEDNGDGNGDGILDSKQNNVTSFKDINDKNYITIENNFSSDNKSGFQQQNVNSTEVPQDAPSNIVFPYGMFEFTITNITTDPVIIKVYLPLDERITGYWKKNLNNGEWENIAESIEHSPEYAPNKTVITIFFQDNGDYDENNSIGIIEDQGGPGFEKNNALLTAVPILDNYGMIFLIFILGTLGFILTKRKSI